MTLRSVMVEASEHSPFFRMDNSLSTRLKSLKLRIRTPFLCMSEMIGTWVIRS